MRHIRRLESVLSALRGHFFWRRLAKTEPHAKFGVCTRQERVCASPIGEKKRFKFAGHVGTSKTHLAPPCRSTCRRFLSGILFLIALMSRYAPSPGFRPLSPLNIPQTRVKLLCTWLLSRLIPLTQKIDRDRFGKSVHLNRGQVFKTRLYDVINNASRSVIINCI